MIRKILPNIIHLPEACVFALTFCNKIRSQSAFTSSRIDACIVRCQRAQGPDKFLKLALICCAWSPKRPIDQETGTCQCSRWIRSARLLRPDTPQRVMCVMPSKRPVPSSCSPRRWKSTPARIKNKQTHIRKQANTLLPHGRNVRRFFAPALHEVVMKQQSTYLVKPLGPLLATHRNCRE